LLETRERIGGEVCAMIGDGNARLAASTILNKSRSAGTVL
jgi:hypothetical protein